MRRKEESRDKEKEQGKAGKNRESEVKGLWRGR